MQAAWCVYVCYAPDMTASVYGKIHTLNQGLSKNTLGCVTIEDLGAFVQKEDRLRDICIFANNCPIYKPNRLGAILADRF